MTDHSYDRHGLDRLTFFSDAVFAIAMTLLVVEVRLPPLPHQVTETALAQALVDLIPQYIGFVVSFLVVGRFWIGHHRTFGRLKRTDDRLVSLNLWLLLTIAFMPFPTTLVSHYVQTRVGVGFYSAWLIIAGLANVAVDRHIIRHHLGGIGSDLELRSIARGAWAPVVIGVLAFVAAMVQPLLALIPLGLSPVIVAVFTRKPKSLPPA